MFLHIGGDVIVNLRDMAAMLDARLSEVGAATAEFLGYMRSLGRLEDVSDCEPRALVICTDRVFLSPVSVVTLRRRIGVLPD